MTIFSSRDWNSMAKPLFDRLRRQTMMNHSRGEKTQPGMAVLVVVPGEEFLGEGSGILQTPKAFRETGPVLQSPEVTFRIRVVIGDVGAAVGLSYPQIRHQERDRLRGHRRTPVRMDGELTGPDLFFLTGIPDKPSGQFRAFPVCDHPAHHVSAEYVENHVKVEVCPLYRSQQLCDVPAPELAGTRSQQFRLRVCRMHKLVTTLAHLALAFQNPVHRADRAMIMPLIEQRRVYRGRRTVLKPFLMKAGQNGFPLRRNQCPRDMPHGGGRRRKLRTFLPVERSAGVIECRAGCSHSDNRFQRSDGCSHEA